MSVITTISLVTADTPPDIPFRIPALFRLAGATHAKLSEFRSKTEHRSFGEVSAEEAAGLFRPNGVLHLALGTPPLAKELCRDFQQKISPDIMSNCCPNNLWLQVGREKIFYLKGFRECARTVGFHYNLCGYGSASNHPKFMELVPTIPSFQRFRKEVESIVGPVDLVIMIKT